MADTRWRLEAFAGGFATLCAELCVLRYVPGQVRVLGYFTNFVLLAAFLGFGVGILVARRWPERAKVAWLAPFAFFAVIAAAEVGRVLHVMPSVEDFLFIEHSNVGRELPLAGFLVGTLVVIAACFVPLGALVGRTLAGERALARYAWNVTGSVAGILFFTALAVGSAPPWVWVAGGGASALVALAGAPRRVQAAGVLSVVAVALVAWRATRGDVWSHYQKIGREPVYYEPQTGVVAQWRLPGLSPDQRQRLQVLPESAGFVVTVNEDSYQVPLDLTDAALAARPKLDLNRMYYDFAYHRRPGSPGKVLVLGAGTGNDVAAALRAGATHVDAVEIDPVIRALGDHHPEHPYADARVTTFIEDGRTFLRRPGRAYDLIVFGMLDSHVLASAAANIRLDSYVFTEESFALARQHLAPGGLLMLTHAVGQPWFVDRMRATLTLAFGKPPILVNDHTYIPFGFTYAAGDSLPAGRPVSPETPILEDDWPFPYLQGHSIPREYLMAIALVAIVAFAAVRAVGGRTWQGASLHFFALGAGFMLLETRALTTLALLFGATWSVNAAVFVGVLLMSLGGTLVAARWGGSARLRSTAGVYVLLFAALAVNVMVVPEMFTGWPALLRGLVPTAIATLPLLASGVLYGLGVSRGRQADIALAANLLGAMAGGLAEYLAMLAGFRYLVFVAAGFYVLALLSARRLPVATGA